VKFEVGGAGSFTSTWKEEGEKRPPGNRCSEFKQLTSYSP
jgi:hypothetical protein